MTPVLISDTNIWIDFQHAGLLNEIFRLPFEFITTDFVIDELQQPEGSMLIGLGLKVSLMDGADVAALFSLSQEHEHSSLPDMSCFYVASKMGYPLLTGDGALRKLAKDESVIVYGSLWLLDRLVEHKVITPAMAAEGLQKMLAAGSRLPVSECDERLKSWMADS